MNESTTAEDGEAREYTKIERNATIKRYDVEYRLDKACSVKVDELFSKDLDGTIRFKVGEDGFLDLSCLDGIRVSEALEEGVEHFLPNRIFVRSYLEKNSSNVLITPTK